MRKDRDRMAAERRRFLVFQWCMAVLCIAALAAALALDASLAPTGSGS